MELEKDGFEKRQDELLAQLPEEFRSYVSGRAWESGHSSGYQEVLNYLEDLIFHLTPAIEKYTLRTLEDYKHHKTLAGHSHNTVQPVGMTVQTSVRLQSGSLQRQAPDLLRIKCV